MRKKVKRKLQTVAFDKAITNKIIMQDLKNMALEYWDWYRKTPCLTDQLWCKVYWTSYHYGPAEFWIIIKEKSKYGKKIIKVKWRKCDENAKYGLYKLYNNIEQDLITLIGKLKTDIGLKQTDRQAQIDSYIKQMY